MLAEAPHPCVAEFQGVYGPFSVPEKLLQHVWWRGEFDGARACTEDGRRVQILHPGRWNRLAGPDFRGARLRLGDGPEISGDVEVHLYARDWAAHGHARDPAYEGVVLHVVLFSPEGSTGTAGAAGRDIPVLALLPLLRRDLEEIAADEAVERLAGRPPQSLGAELDAGAETPDFPAQLRGRAELRWRQKVGHARLRIRRLGWEVACHHAALEILGYRFNRSPMLRLAAHFPVRDWGTIDPDWAYAQENGRWHLRGTRPANHPRRRLGQYAAWTRARPGWPAGLAEWSGQPPAVSVDGPTRAVRRSPAFVRLHNALTLTAGGVVTGRGRFDTLVCDGFLPLLAARAESSAAEFFPLWHHWFAGDLPDAISRELRRLGVCEGRDRPLCHGMAQGLLGWLIDREESAPRFAKPGGMTPVSSGSTRCDALARPKQHEAEPRLP